MKQQKQETVLSLVIAIGAGIGSVLGQLQFKSQLETKAQCQEWRAAAVALEPMNGRDELIAGLDDLIAWFPVEE